MNNYKFQIKVLKKQLLINKIDILTLKLKIETFKY